MSRISIAQLFDDKKDKLKLTWIAGQSGGAIELSDEKIAQSGQGMIGHLNFIHPDWIQVISIDEIHYLKKLEAASLRKKSINLLSRVTWLALLLRTMLKYQHLSSIWPAHSIFRCSILLIPVWK